MTTLFRNTSPGALTRQQAVAREKKRMIENRRRAAHLAAQGRGEDTEVAHVARGEIVLPHALQTPEVMAAVHKAATARDISLAQLAVGSAGNSINPTTGAPEFGFWNDLFRGKSAAAATPSPVPQSVSPNRAPDEALPLPSVQAALKKAQAMQGLPDDQAAHLVGVTSNAAAERIYGRPRSALSFEENNGVFTTLANRADRLADLTRPEVATMLDDIIAYAEGGAADRRYGGSTFKGPEHPGGLPRPLGPDGKEIGSKHSPAGLFQQTEETWYDMRRKMGLTDFSDPLNQRLAAVAQLERQGALEPLRRGDFDVALRRAAGDGGWAALPEGKQPRITYDEAKQIFEEGVRRRRGIKPLNRLLY